MGDVVVTVPRAQWPAWLREGDLPGQAARGVSHFWLAPPLPPMAPGERVYVVASNRLRGYAPLVGVEERCTLRPHDGMGCLMRAGGAVAVTVLRYFPAFQGWRDRFWDRAEEVPFPRWQDLRAWIPDPDAPPYVPCAPCHRCGRCVPVARQGREPVQVLSVLPGSHTAQWHTQQRIVCRPGDGDGCRPAPARGEDRTP